MSLGKGLGALITPTTRKKITHATGEGSATAPERIWSVPVSEVAPNPEQPRRHFSEEELKELADSIKEHGVLQPLIVSEKENGGYQIIAGERRWRASRMAGVATVPVIVKELAEEKKLEVALIENIQRENLNPIEEAFAYKRLIEEFGLTQQQVSEKVGKSRPAVANAIRLLELPDEVHNALIHKKISTGQARALLTLNDTKQQLDMLASMLGEKMTVREVEKETASRRVGGVPQRRDPNLAFLENKIRTALGTKTTINPKGERGTIVLDYYSQDELLRIVKTITE